MNPRGFLKVHKGKKRLRRFWTVTGGRALPRGCSGATTWVPSTHANPASAASFAGAPSAGTGGGTTADVCGDERNLHGVAGRQVLSLARLPKQIPRR